MGKTAAETISTMLAVFARVDPRLRESITFDNDTLRTMRDMTTWFCDAYALPRNASHRRLSLVRRHVCESAAYLGVDVQLPPARRPSRALCHQTGDL
jgi:hypothetical protein